jgi:putative ABC transport system ATP-binding protein
MSEGLPLIQLKEATKIYGSPKRQVVAMENITLTIYAGEFVTVMGPSGSGKSTLLHLIGCLDTLTSGEYLFEGVPAQRLGRNRLAEIRNRKIGFVFQTFCLLPRLTAIENVALPLVYRGIASKEQKNRALAMLEVVGLKDRATHSPAELSGGEQQRVAIARALIGQPALILADEPTGNLDSETSTQIMALLEKIRRETEITILLVTHDPNIATLGDRTIKMRDGEIVLLKP